MNPSQYSSYGSQYGQSTQQTAPYGTQQGGQYAGQYSGQYATPPGYNGAYAQSQTQYTSTPPVLRNPFVAPLAAAGYAGSPEQQYEVDENQQVAQWHAAYAPVDPNEKDLTNKRGGANATTASSKFTSVGPRPPGVADVPTAAGDVDAEGKTVLRKGGGQSWEDKTLLEWDPAHFRIMVGNLAGEVTDDSLAKAFAAYGVSKARVIRDKVTTKSRGFGFVSFFDGEQGFKAAREMAGKYIGSHPVTIQRSKTDLRPVAKKDDHRNHKNRGRNNHHNKNRGGQNHDPLKANTGAGVEKKQVKAPAGLKVLG